MNYTMVKKMVLTNYAMMRAASHLLSSEKVLITLLQVTLFSSITIISWKVETARIKNFMPQSSHIVFKNHKSLLFLFLRYFGS